MMMIVTGEGTMLMRLKVALVQKKVKQTRMAVELGWDPAKLSRIVNGIAKPTPEDQEKIASYLHMEPAELFA
jgi:transcriptional regulator with XRE-family HTH domain